MEPQILHFKRIHDEVKAKVNDGLDTSQKNQLRELISKLIDKKSHMFAISLGKLVPDAFPQEQFITSCQKHQPLLLDELIGFPGIDEDGLRQKILSNLQLPALISRINLWWPQEILPEYAQSTLVKSVYKATVYESTEGPIHKRELSENTGNLFVQVLQDVGTRITEDSPILALFRAAHYVLQGMERNMELHHQLDDSFASTVFNKLWEVVETNPTEQNKLNALAFTLSHRDSYPDAVLAIASKLPNEAAVLKKLWDVDAKDITKELTTMKKENNVGQVITTRGAYDINF